jgi:hypothetical protein
VNGATGKPQALGPALAPLVFDLFIDQKLKFCFRPLLYQWSKTVGIKWPETFPCMQTMILNKQHFEQNFARMHTSQEKNEY